jgi:hypothetical protein
MEDPMPMSTDKRRPRRSKAQAAEHALAHRVAASLDPASLGKAETGPGPAEIAPKPAAPKMAKHMAATPAMAVTAGPQSELFEAGVGRINEAVASAQEMARETAQSLADSRLHTAQSFVAFQQKVLAMVHANLNQSFAAAQSFVRAPNVGEAIRVQNRYAQGAVKALTAQAAELRSLSADLAREAGEPWKSHWTKSIDRLRHGLGA